MMSKRRSPSKPNVPLRARLIAYRWNGIKLAALLGFGPLPKDFEQVGDGPAVHTVVTFESGITSGTAIAGLLRIIDQIKMEGLPSPDFLVTQEVADQAKADGGHDE